MQQSTQPGGPDWGLHTSLGGRLTVYPGGLPIVAAWNSPPVAWLSRVVLIAVAAPALAEVVRDTAEVL
ncbi:MAG: hypothetical protein WD096_09100 [Actinomycetota bacterium]